MALFDYTIKQLEEKLQNKEITIEDLEIGRAHV